MNKIFFQLSVTMTNKKDNSLLGTKNIQAYYVKICTDKL